MKDFATTAREILEAELDPLAIKTGKLIGEQWDGCDVTDMVAALVAAHEADKREAVREELETMQQIDFSDDYEPGELHGVTLDKYLASRLAALDTQDGSESAHTPITPLGDNAAGGRDET